MGPKIERRTLLLAGAGAVSLALSDTKLSTLAGAGIWAIKKLGNLQDSSSLLETDPPLAETLPKLPTQFSEAALFETYQDRWAPLFVTPSPEADRLEGPATLIQTIAVADPIVNAVVHDHFQQTITNHDQGEPTHPRLGDQFQNLYQLTHHYLETTLPTDTAGQPLYRPDQILHLALERTVFAFAAVNNPYWQLADVVQNFHLTIYPRTDLNWPGRWLNNVRDQLATVYPAPTAACESPADYIHRCEGTDRIQHLALHLFASWVYLNSLSTHRPEIAKMPLREAIDKFTSLSAFLQLGHSANEQKVNAARAASLSGLIGTIWEDMESFREGFWAQSQDLSPLEIATSTARQAQIVLDELQTGQASFDVEYDDRANVLGTCVASMLYYLSSEQQLQNLFTTLNAPWINNPPANPNLAPLSRPALEKKLFATAQRLAANPPPRYNIGALLKYLQP